MPILQSRSGPGGQQVGRSAVIGIKQFILKNLPEMAPDSAAVDVDTNVSVVVENGYLVSIS
jgi:hypothetical protein